MNRRYPYSRTKSNTVNDRVTASAVTDGKLFRCVCRAGKAWGHGVTEKGVWHVVKQNAGKLGLSRLAPHDLRRSCARMCHSAGGELEQIQSVLGHVSVQTTERPWMQAPLEGAVNDRIGIEPFP
jgi:integrase